jgi:serine protease AprX
MKKFLLLISLTLFCRPGFSKISPYLEKHFTNNDRADVIVYFKTNQDLNSARSILARSSRVRSVVERLKKQMHENQKTLLASLRSKNLEHKNFYAANAMLVRQAPLRLVEEWVQQENISHIGFDVQTGLDDWPFPIPDWPFPDPTPQPQEPIGISSDLKLIKVDKVWTELGVKGQGIVVAGQDTGVFWEHNALIKQYRGSQENGVDHNYNWMDAIEEAPCSSGGLTPCDDNDHGTHTLGTIVGDDGKGNQIGVAPEAQWMACRNMRDGVGTVSSYLTCFDFFLAPYPLGGDFAKDGKPEMAPHIVNNSWSCPKKEGCEGNEFSGVVEAYKAAGIMLVAAAGNDGPNCGTASEQPASYAGDILVVGAWNTYNNDIAFFSSRGPSPLGNRLAPNIIASGSAVMSAVKSGKDIYDDKTGTSMASPHVAGVVALLWSYRPELIGQLENTMDIIQSTADPLTGSGSCPGFPSDETPNAVFGYGMVNAYRALMESTSLYK